MDTMNGEQVTHEMEQSTNITGVNQESNVSESKGGVEWQGKKPFSQVIEEDYKQEYEEAVGQRIQAAIQQRFRKQQDSKPKENEYQPIMEALREKYDMQNGQPKEIAERIRQEMEEQKKNTEREVQLRQHFASLTKQAEEMKQTFPDFDLFQEMRNPDFMRLTAPGSGVSLKHAFYAVHGEELQQESMRYAAEKTGEKIAQSVISGASRPIENGAINTNRVIKTIDVANMDKATRDEYRRRIKNGELINFRDLI